MFNVSKLSCTLFSMQPHCRQCVRSLTKRSKQWPLPARYIGGRRIGGLRYISIQATPSTDTARISVNSRSTEVSSPDATFEILGSPYSLLSVSLSPSQDLYTRRGTLVGFAGQPENTISTLRILSPIRRALIGVPFLYQRITSTSPISALISTKSSNTSFAILQLDGTTDWKLFQRSSLLAWTGTKLQVMPRINLSLSISYWGSTNITGRGLLALTGSGQIYALELSASESYIAHPSNVLAYTISSPSPPPTPFRFKTNNITFQIPTQLGNFFPSSRFLTNLKQSDTYKFFANIAHRIRTWSRRTIWGDRLFLRFQGPTTLLLQSRAARVSDVLSGQEVNEIADAPPGVVQEAISNVTTESGAVSLSGRTKSQGSRMGVEGATPSAAEKSGEFEKRAFNNRPKMSIASVRDGKVSFETTTTPGSGVPKT